MKISQKQYAEFLEHYAWQLLKSPDYRLGQAFINYFPEISKSITVDNEGTIVEMQFYYETDNKRVQELIDQWVSDH